MKGQPVTDEFLRRCAHILGDGSAAKLALDDRDRRRAKGEDAHIFWVRDKGLLLVGPMPKEIDQ